jgi:hypothetical protein
MTAGTPDEIHLRAPRIDELALLSDLCLRSKAVWGYDAARMGSQPTGVVGSGSIPGRRLPRLEFAL